jgi:hypothetical protein
MSLAKGTESFVDVGLTNGTTYVYLSLPPRPAAMRPAILPTSR